MSQEEREAITPTPLSPPYGAPYPRRHWGPGVRLLLWLLRVYVILAVPLVIYAFATAALR